MSENEVKNIQTNEQMQTVEPQSDSSSQEQTHSELSIETLKQERDEYIDKYKRLYAEFENFKKKTQKDKEELLKFANESLVYELLPVIDSLEMALKHTDNVDTLKSLTQGVENTFRELLRVLEKFGLKRIDALDKPFDPSFHHAMSQSVRSDIDENIVVEEFRKGYIFAGKVLRPSFVAVSKKPDEQANEK